METYNLEQLIAALTAFHNNMAVGKSPQVIISIEFDGQKITQSISEISLGICFGKPTLFLT